MYLIKETFRNAELLCPQSSIVHHHYQIYPQLRESLNGPLILFVRSLPFQNHDADGLENQARRCRDTS